MKITVDSKTLARACATACKNILNKPLLPIMSSIHFVVENDVLRLTSTDNENWTVHQVPVTCSHLDEESPMAFCIEGKAITEFLLAIPAQPITIEVKRVGDAEFYKASISHSSGKAELPVQPADEFPIFRQVESEGSTIQADLLKRIVSLHRFAVLGDAEVKPQLTAILLDFKGNTLVTVSTDCQRLVRLEHPDFESEVRQVLLHPKCVTLLLPMLDDVLADKDDMGEVMIRTNGSNICIQTGKASIYSRMSEVRYPNYNSVIPPYGYNEKKAVVDRRDLMAAISRAMLFANSASRLIRFCFDPDGFVTLEGQDVELSKSSKEKVACTYTDSAPFFIGLNGSLLKELLAHMTSEQVRFEMKDQSRCVLLFEENGDTNLLMLLVPMMLNC